MLFMYHKRLNSLIKSILYLNIMINQLLKYGKYKEPITKKNASGADRTRDLPLTRRTL